MEKKYIIVSKKNGKPIDNKQYTKEEFKKKAYELMEQTGLDRDAMNDTFTYQEVAEGGVSTEENTSGSPKATPNAANDEFGSEDKSDNYEFHDKNDTYQATVTDDDEGWNKVLDNLGRIPPETAELVKEYNSSLKLTDKNKSTWPMKKNAIRVLYLFNEFLTFYAACSEESFPVELTAYLKKKRTFASAVHGFDGLDGIKEDMADIIEDMLEELDAYLKGKGNLKAHRAEFYDEIKEFDEEIENLHGLLKTVGMWTGRVGAGDWNMIKRSAEQLTETDDAFKQFCGGEAPTNKKLSEYLMKMATEKYHLGRIKMNSNDENSTPEYMNPENQESKTVRLSEKLDDYLDLKHAKILDTDEDKKKLKEITDSFEKGDMTQQDAQGAINRLVIAARDKIVESLRLFFKFVGITKTDKMNQFTSGLKRLDEPDYQNNWRSLVTHYKESIEKKIEIFKNAHSNDMTKESLDECVNILNNLLKNADVLLKDVEAKNGTQLMAHSREISERIKEVQEKTAAAQKAFPKQ